MSFVAGSRASPARGLRTIRSTMECRLESKLEASRELGGNRGHDHEVTHAHPERRAKRIKGQIE